MKMLALFATVTASFLSAQLAVRQGGWPQSAVEHAAPLVQPVPPGAPESSCSSLATLFASNGGGSPGGQMYFDLQVNKGGGVTVQAIDTSTGAALASAVGVDLYTVPGTYVGKEHDPTLWTLASSGAGFSAGFDQPTAIDLWDFHLAAGSYGVSLVMTTPTGHRYTNGNGTNQLYSNADLTLQAGAASNLPWSGSVFTPRVWNGTIHYDCSRPQTYCTSKPSSCGTAPFLMGPAASTSQGASGPGSFDITVDPVPGGNSPALAIYTTTGRQAVPILGALGFLCIDGGGLFRVLPPTGATGPACAASYVIDFGAFLATQTADAALLPPNLPAQVDLQAWYRDPPNVGGANLTHALSFEVTP